MTHRTIRLAGAAALLWAATAQAAPTTEEKIDLLTDELERLKAEVARQSGESAAGSAANRATLGGYGELHYNNLDSKKEIDLHRFVLAFNYRFTDRIRFFSELEIEHGFIKDTQSGTASRGEVEVEQAFLEFDLTQTQRAQVGVFLLPIGILNETHEPPTFYGVERNPVETNIIPTTWWEGGAGFKGELPAGLRYDVNITSGLRVATTGSSAWNIRSGRQKVSSAPADSLAYNGRLRWAAIPGVELATSIYYQNDITQSSQAVAAVPAVLGEGHAIVSKGRLTIKALYAQWHLTGGSATVNPAANGSDVQNGWYVEPSWLITPKLGVFARYNEYDNRAGALNQTRTERRQTDLGLNYWPHPQVVVKFDVQSQAGASDDDGFNLGVGYMF